MMEYYNHNKQNYKRIFDITVGPLKEKLLMAAIQLKIFNYLIQPKTAYEITDILGSNMINTELFLNALVSLDLIEKEEGLYSNTEISKEIFINGNEYYLGEHFLSTRHWYNIDLQELTSLIIKGPSKTMDISSEKVWGKQAKLSANYQKLEAVQQASKLVSSLPEYPSLKKMLDLGAGSGIVGINIIENHPTMKGVLFDKPIVANVAKEFVSEYHLEERIEVRGGDYIKDDIGSGYDLVWARLTFNFHQQQLETIIGKVYDSLNTGGVFIYYGDGIKNEMTYPQESVMHMLIGSLKSGYPLNLAEGKVAEVMLNCGFRSVRSKTIMTNSGEMDIDIARK